MNGSALPAGVASDEDLRRQRCERLVHDLAVRCPTCRVRLNHNAKTMLSLRRRQGGSVVSMHVGLLDHEDALTDLPAWIASDGRRITPRLRQALQAVWRHQRRTAVAAERADFPALEPIPYPFDLCREFERIHATWFAHLPRPGIRWARSSPRRTLSSIRFACYRRRPVAEIVVNPRLARPWVPMVFVEHVLYHELCHHAQACAPLRGEPPHSRRFRQWEAQYPHHDLALAWERLHLDRLLQE
jgi:hypothetical protein